MTQPDQRTKIYFNFLETLAKRAKINTTLAFRAKIRTMMLRYIATIMKGTSIYLCHHDFTQKVSIVQNMYVMDTMIISEYTDDIGETYPELEGGWNDWLYGGHHTPRILQTSELREDDPEYEEYGEYEHVSIIMGGVYFEETLWGYLELWDAQHYRDYPAAEQAMLTKAAALISETILTPAG